MKEQINSKTVRAGEGDFQYPLYLVRVHSFLQAWLTNTPLFKVRYELALEQKKLLKDEPSLSLLLMLYFFVLVQSQFIVTATCINI